VLGRVGWEIRREEGVFVVARKGDADKVGELGKVLVGSNDEFERRMAAHELGTLTTPGAVRVLVSGLRDRSPSVRFQCLEALWGIESDFEMRCPRGRVSILFPAKADVLALVGEAVSSVEDRGRRAWRFAVTLLGRIHVPEVRPLALEGLSDPDPRVRLIAAKALADTATPEDTSRLLDFVQSETDWAIRREVVLALARIGGPDVILARKELMAKGAEELRLLVLEALSLLPPTDRALALLGEGLKTGSPNITLQAADALGRLDTPAAEELLIGALKSGDEWIRIAALKGLVVPGRRRSVAVCDALMGLFSARERSRPAERAALVHALVWQGGPPVEDALVTLSQDTDPMVRLAATRGLVCVGGSQALARLHEVAEDPVRTVATEALRGLGWLGGVKEAEKLASIAKDRSLGRDGAEGALLGLGDLLPAEARDIAVQTLLELMDDPVTCPFAVGRAAVALADPRLVPGLLKVQSKNRAGAPLRVDCMDALGKIGTKETIEALARNWWEYENMARYQGGRALRDNLHRPAVFETLLALTKVSGDSLEAAVFSLANSRNPRAVKALVEILERGGEGALGAAISLGQIGDPAATDALLRAALNQVHPARFAAARALRMRDLAWQPTVKEALIRLYGWQPDGTPPRIEEQKSNTWVLRRWARDYDDMTVASLTYESAAAYDPRRGIVIQWGAHGKRYDSPQTGETWVYDPAQNLWRERGLRELPPGTCMTREICYDTANDRLVVRGASGGGHGWLSTKEQVLRRSSPWTYDPVQDRWLPMRAVAPTNFALSSLIEYDRRTGLVVGLGREPAAVWTYDTYVNEWFPQPSSESRPAHGFGAVAYDTDRGRLLFLGENAFWAYEVRTAKWSDLGVTNTPRRAGPLVYDSVNGVALAFRPGRGGTAVFAYKAGSDRWERYTTDGMQPDYTNWDAVFDEKRNVVIVCGGKVTSCPGSPNCRETWTYRFAIPAKPRPPPLLPPDRAQATVTAKAVRIRWNAVADKRVTGYRIERRILDPVSGIRCVELNNGGLVTSTRFEDDVKPSPPSITSYLVYSVGADGSRSVDCAVAQILPPIPVGVVATWDADRRARVTWEKGGDADVAGYNVYRADVEFGRLYGNNPVKNVGVFKKVNVGPVTETWFVDPEPAEEGEQEWRLRPRAYAVRAVNSAGLESGRSGWVITLPPTPKRIEARRREDGSVVLRWECDDNPNVIGYVAYRMDNWRNDLVTRVNELPVPSTMLVDFKGYPTGERQRYWVVGVDRFGQEGPSGT
ncbi:MAG: HEAT repeat domain-containing protein, partial [Kiritimatiellae bacterium]|nr:HEAT repeat domain-containing protein [Kiritimatiellia bacterium]